MKNRRARARPGIRVFDEGAFHTFYLLAFRIDAADSGLVDRLVHSFPAVTDLVIVGEPSGAAIRRLSERLPVEVLLLDLEQDEALPSNVDRIVATVERVSRIPRVRS